MYKSVHSFVTLSHGGVINNELERTVTVTKRIRNEAQFFRTIQTSRIGSKDHKEILGWLSRKNLKQSIKQAN